jgi:NAD(P)-dependent dehydrogenase (short-subunit alcohol dehydrogenase family)
MSEQKVAIVTGGGKGIGAAIALQLLSESYRVVIAELSPGKATFSWHNPEQFLLIKTDISKENSVKKMFEATLEHFGRIDCVINNAGVLPDEKMKFENISLNTWNKYIGTNLTGAFLCSKYAVKSLRNNKGCIVNIASTRALQSEGNNEPYAASKGGLVSLTHEMAISLGPDIRVNCISPGWIHTQNERLKKSDHAQHPVGRIGHPEDIAHLVLFLISDKATFITGQNFIADGGMTVKMIYN